MPNPFTKGWKYLMSSFDRKIDENADPKVQTKQAADEARRHHQEVSDHAAQVIGTEKQLSLKLDRLRAERDKREAEAREAVQQAEKAAGSGDAERAAQLNTTAELLAAKLVELESELEQETATHQQAAQAADEARRLQRRSEAQLKQQLAEVDRLNRQVDQVNMQQATNQASNNVAAVDKDDAVAGFDEVQEKIERRYAEALGRQELAESTAGPETTLSNAVADQRASARLAQLRAELGSGTAPRDSARELEERGDDNSA